MIKVTILEGLFVVENGPKPDPALPDEEGQTVALLQAMTWAMGQIAATSAQLMVTATQRDAARDEAKKAIQRIRAAMH